MKVLKNVIAVSAVQSYDLEGVERKSPGVVSVPAGVPWEEIKIQVPAKLSIINKVEDKNTVWTTTLTFRTCEDRFDRKHPCYMVTLANGQRLLIGSQERPWPVTVTSDTMPDNLADSQLQEVTVTLTSRSRPPVIA